MRQALWLAFQASIVAFWMYAYSDIAEHDGTSFHIGQAFMIGLIWAFVATIILKIIAGQLQFWSGFIRQRSVLRANRKAKGLGRIGDGAGDAQHEPFHRVHRRRR